MDCSRVLSCTDHADRRHHHVANYGNIQVFLLICVYAHRYCEKGGSFHFSIMLGCLHGLKEIVKKNKKAKINIVLNGL